MKVLLGYVNLKKAPVLLLVMGFFVLLTQACSSTHCRLQEAENMKKASEKVAAVPTVRVFKYDGSLQCGMGKSIALEDMKLELKGIKIISAVHKNDGLMRIQLCGSPTGDANVFEISKDDLEKALALNFREWAFD
jgi:hypothetical protein